MGYTTVPSPQLVRVNPGFVPINRFSGTSSRRLNPLSFDPMLEDLFPLCFYFLSLLHQFEIFRMYNSHLCQESSGDEPPFPLWRVHQTISLEEPSVNA